MGLFSKKRKKNKTDPMAEARMQLEMEMERRRFEAEQQAAAAERSRQQALDDRIRRQDELRYQTEMHERKSEREEKQNIWQSDREESRAEREAARAAAAERLEQIRADKQLEMDDRRSREDKLNSERTQLLELQRLDSAAERDADKWQKLLEINMMERNRARDERESLMRQLLLLNPVVGAKVITQQALEAVSNPLPPLMPEYANQYEEGSITPVYSDNTYSSL